VAKQQVASLQANEIAAVRKKLGSFELRQLQFRDEFHRQDFFRFSCEDPYKTLDHIHHRICAMEKYLEELSNWAALFEVPVSEFRGLKNCRRETIMIKQLWDYSYVIRSSVDNWKTTHWKEIDVERMEIECKHFAKNIRGLDKEMRAWDAYIGLDASVRDLLTSLKVCFLKETCLTCFI
jgi:dynein heavy chain